RTREPQRRVAFGDRSGRVTGRDAQLGSRRVHVGKRETTGCLKLRTERDRTLDLGTCGIELAREQEGTGEVVAGHRLFAGIAELDRQLQELEGVRAEPLRLLDVAEHQREAPTSSQPVLVELVPVGE